MRGDRERRIAAALELVKRMETGELEVLVYSAAGVGGSFQIMSLDRIARERREAFEAGWLAAREGGNVQKAYLQFIAEE